MTGSGSPFQPPFASLITLHHRLSGQRAIWSERPVGLKLAPVRTECDLASSPRSCLDEPGGT